MLVNRTKLFIQTALLITCFCIVAGLKTETKQIGVSNAVTYFKRNVTEFSLSAIVLKKSIAQLNNKEPATINAAKVALKNSRMNYKKIEFFMNYFFESSSLIYNKPAKVEVEEPYMEYQEPSGFQVIEALLFDDDPAAQQQSLTEQAELLSSSAADLNALLYGFEANDKQLLESVRLELYRIITLNITGYDAPELKSGISESYQSLSAVAEILEPFIKADATAGLKLKHTTLQSLTYLKDNQDFDSFNRMEFLTRFALPMQEQLRDFIKVTHQELNDKSELNYDAKNIFDPQALLPKSFPAYSVSSTAKKELGKKLFSETALSGNLKRSCASCHHPERYFSDGLKTSLAFDGLTYVQRNAPTLIYAGFQYSQFWDGRAKGLPQQIETVIANPMEMNGDHQVIINGIKKSKYYQEAFKNAYPGKNNHLEPVNRANLSDALAAYIMDLAPRNSAFDSYMEGDKTAMSAAQIRGFNLFMGKGQCGSCHFAPLFNGLIPPLYKLTEYEILGTPANDDFNKLIKDTDVGRYGFFPISYYQAAFKTPTVRNVEMTAPYMHNGVFKDLEKVVQFYNLGGGAGLHLDLPGQTLSAKPLHLSDQEVHEIVVFMQSLTDKLE